MDDRHGRDEPGEHGRADHGDTTGDPPGLKETVRVFFAGVPGNVEYSGAAPSLVAGISQLNARLPDSLPPGTNLEAVPISIQLGDGAPSGHAGNGRGALA